MFDQSIRRQKERKRNIEHARQRKCTIYDTSCQKYVRNYINCKQIKSSDLSKRPSQSIIQLHAVFQETKIKHTYTCIFKWNEVST